MSAERKPRSRGRAAATRRTAPEQVNQEAYLNAFQAMGRGAAIFNAKGTTIEANDQMAYLVGCTPSELAPGTVWKELLPAKWASRSVAQWKRAPKTEHFSNHMVDFSFKKKGKAVSLVVDGSVIDKAMDGNSLILVTASEAGQEKKVEDTLRRANEKLQARADTLEAQLKEAKIELAEAKKEVGRTNKSVKKLNDSMKLLMTQVQEQKTDLENRIVSNFRLTVEPIVEHLLSRSLTGVQRHLLETLQFSIKNITSYFGINISREGANLSPRETQICQMIRQGKDSREIAETMGLSYQTVIVHRKNIRKKLGIKKVKQNLTTYLQQSM